MIRTLAAALATTTCIVALATPAAAQTREFNVPAGSLRSALDTFARQSGRQVIYSGDVRLAHSAGVRGARTAEAALDAILAGTGFVVKHDRSGALAIVKAGNVPSADTGNSGSTPSESVAEAVGNEAEIVVTALKRSERLLEVPQSVGVVAADTLVKSGVTQLRDFANTIPGVNLQTLGAGVGQVSIRGVTAGFDAGSTVATYIDDVPFGSSSAFVDGSQRTLDAALFDLDRVEVLRGPQGTLYGASAIGGLRKYVTRAPSSTAFSGDLRGAVSSTRNGGISYNGAASVNAPLAEGVAGLRAGAFYSRDGGFVDNVTLGRKDVDRSKIYGGRLDLLLTPIDKLSIRLGAFLLNISRDGEPTINYNRATGVPLYGDLNQGRVLSEPFEQHYRLVSATINYDFSGATLTSVTSYQTIRIQAFYDGSEIIKDICGVQGDVCGAAGVPSGSDTDKFTHDILQSSPSVWTIEWLVGGFYTNESSKRTLAFALFDAALRPIQNRLYDLSAPSHYKEYAGFGDLPVRLSDKFDVTGGVRVAKNEQSYTQNGSGAFIGSLPRATSSESVVTYLANARYHFSNRAVAYARFATGYQPGGPNLLPRDPATGQPIAQPTFDPAKLNSYEFGFKGETTDRTFAVDAAVYYIDWKDIQVQASANGFGYFTNITGGATVRGAELTLTARPTKALSVVGAFAYQDARTERAEPLLGARRHERLPNVPKFTASVTSDYVMRSHPLAPTLGATLRFVSDRNSSFDASGGFPQYHLPDYITVDLRGGLSLGPVDAQLFVRNLFDTRAQLSAATQFGSPRVAVLPPRTIGISLSSKF